VMILKALAPDGYRQAVSGGASVAAPNLAVLRGPAPSVQIQAAPSPHEVPSLPAGLLWGLAVLALLSAAGAGWTRALLGSGHDPETMAALAPVMGAAVLMVGGLGAAELGVRLGGVGGVATYLVLALSGAVAAVVDMRRLRAPAPS
jgi:hypothetical protein